VQLPDLRSVGSLRGWRAGEQGEVVLTYEQGCVSLAVARDGAVRVRAHADSELPADPGPGIGRSPWRPAPAEPYRREQGEIVLGFEGTEGAAEVELSPSSFALRVRDRFGRLLAALGGLEVGRSGAARVELSVPPAARYFGFGEKMGGLDKRGSTLVMRNRDSSLRQKVDPLYVSIPFFLELRSGEPSPSASDPTGLATGFLLDAIAPSRFDVAASDADRVRMETLAGGLDLTIFPGPLPADVLRRYTARTGRPPLPPLWALGHHQSRWSYANERQLRRVAHEIRRRGIPTDVLHLDIDYMDGCRVFTFDSRRFPDPEGLFRELHGLGFRVVGIVDPGVKVDEAYPVYREGHERDVFCRNEDGTPFSLRVWPGRAALPDFNRADVRAWWGDQHRPLLDAGLAGIWNDMNEPAGWRADVRLGRAILPLRGQNLSRVVQADPAQPKQLVPHEHVRNAFGLQQCRATRQALEKQRPEERPFVLSRSGCAGIGQQAAIWTGDNASRWEHLRMSVPMLLNLSLSGAPFCGADIGGFAGHPSPELYLRWMQIGALYPFARTHTWWLQPRQEPWRFGQRAENIARRALELRMRLLPYLYGLFREAEENGSPVWRPLFFEFPDDDEAATIEDQVLLGSWLLAAPVLERGARQRRVYLPEGTWFSFDDDARYVGPRFLQVAAPLERLPLFVRAGAVIPTHSPVRHVGEPPAEPLVLEVFPGGDGTTVLVEDDGLTTAYRQGAFARTELRLRDPAAGRLRLELGAREGSHALAPRRVRIRVHACPRPQTVRLDAEPIPEREDLPGYSARDGRLDVRFEDDGRARALEVEPSP
jgi:alpha-glucosidase